MLSYVQTAVLNNTYNFIEGSESNRKDRKKQANNNLAFLEEGKKVRARTEETKGDVTKKKKKKKNFRKEFIKPACTFLRL
jgi:hypothetical protein